jgi:hypothetical protein
MTAETNILREGGQILLPEGMRPTNLHLTPQYKMVREDGAEVAVFNKARVCTADVYNICERIREVSPRLYLLELEQESVEGNKFGYAVMEQCSDGVDRVIFRVTKKGLDGRTITKLRRLMAVDLHTRIAICDRERDKFEAEQAEAAREQLWETVGGPMQIELERNGFIDGRGVSYRKLNRAARRRRSVMGVA